VIQCIGADAAPPPLSICPVCGWNGPIPVSPAGITLCPAYDCDALLAAPRSKATFFNCLRYAGLPWGRYVPEYLWKGGRR
jgi:hypothetical protein